MESNSSSAVFWNIWSGRYADDVYAFLESHNDIDVFCLTEVTDIGDANEITKNNHNLVYSGDEAAAEVDNLDQLCSRFASRREISYITPDYQDWECIKTGAKFKGVGFGSAMLMNHGVRIIGFGYENLNLEMHNVKSRVLQWVIYEKHGALYLVAHFHGVWIKGNTKGDHIARSQQSLQVRLVLLQLANFHKIDKIIFGGDFNLDITTKALAALEGTQYRNLIKEFSITNTRTERYRHLGLEGYSMYADYVLVSQKTNVHSFEVQNDVLASDHAPLIVRFS
jgi:endonuclease/exonuclease/phosphatase family metal-dependent hydrolase